MENNENVKYITTQELYTLIYMTSINLTHWDQINFGKGELNN